jgi:phospholipid/cholesterol/gamma-HCH transport system substrate-binding protein
MLQDNGKLNRMISDIQSITSNIRNHNDEISLALNNIANISDSLAQSELKSVISNTNETLKYAHSILKKIDNGEGTIGMLVNNDSLYRNLESTSQDLDRFLRDLQEHPKKYINVSVFGGRNKE